MSLTATIIGITSNVRQRDFAAADPDPVAYLPYRTDPRGFMVLLARSDGDPARRSPALVREEIRAIDPDLPLFGIRTLNESLAQQRWPFRIFGTMFAIFAFIALVLSAVGLYAVTAYSITQRTQEIGVRTALGAASGQVMWLFLRRGLIQTGIGLDARHRRRAGRRQDLRAIAAAGADERPRPDDDPLDRRRCSATVALAACVWPATARDDAGSAGRAAARLTRSRAASPASRRSGGRPSLRSGRERPRSLRSRGNGAASAVGRQNAAQAARQLAAMPPGERSDAAIPARAKRCAAIPGRARATAAPPSEANGGRRERAATALDTRAERLPIISSRPHRLLADRGTDC